jgi:hypothetical protein
MITAHKRGHQIYFKDGEWFYLDNDESATKDRPCKRCGKLPTKEGYDSCLGHIEGAVSACCGHGVEEPILIKERII